MSTPPRTFSPAELAEAAAWAANRGTGWRAEPVHVDDDTVGLGICRPEGPSEAIKAVFPMASPNDFAFHLERTMAGIAVLGCYFETIGVFATLQDALKAGVAAHC
jgi:hypothetical protein